jgi:hypothetical protein
MRHHVRVRTLTLAAALMALSAVSAGAAACPPTLRLVGTQPLLLRGSGFHPRERVRVTAPARSARVVRTTRRGTFRVELEKTTPTDRCSAFAVVARGAHGETVILKVRPQCPPA